MKLTSLCYNVPTSLLQFEALISFFLSFLYFHLWGSLFFYTLVFWASIPTLLFFLSSINKYNLHQFLDFCESKALLF